MKTAARPADATSAARRKLRTTAERTLAGSALPTSGRGAAAAPGLLLGLGLPSATSGSGLGTAVGTAVGKAPARATKAAPAARDPKMLSDAELAQEATRLKATLDADHDRYWQEGLHERYGRILQEQGQRGQEREQRGQERERRGQAVRTADRLARLTPSTDREDDVFSGLLSGEEKYQTAKEFNPELQRIERKYDELNMSLSVQRETNPSKLLHLSSEDLDIFVKRMIEYTKASAETRSHRSYFSVLVV